MASKRSYPRFKRDESTVVALERLTATQVLKAESLVKSLVPQEQVVHGVRLAFKFLRAMLRLSREALGPAFVRRENARLRKAALSLSLWRDEKVVRDTLTELGDEMSELSHAAVEDALRQWQQKTRPQHRHHKSLPVTLREALAALRTFQRNLDKAAWAAPGWEAVSKGMKKSYRKAHHSLQLAEAAGIDELFHDARKRVKDLYYHVSLVEPALPKDSARLEKRLLKLQALLGNDHDLSVAREVMSHANSPEAAALKALRKRSVQLRRKIGQRADKVFCAETKSCLNKTRRRLKKWPVTTG